MESEQNCEPENSDNSSELGLRKRRKRTIITPDQLDKLEKSFKCDPWPNRSRKERLAKDLGKSEQFVSVWFQNKRARLKREEEVKRKTTAERIKRKMMEGKKFPIAKSPTRTSNTRKSQISAETSARIANILELNTQNRLDHGLGRQSKNDDTMFDTESENETNASCGMNLVSSSQETAVTVPSNSALTQVTNSCHLVQSSASTVPTSITSFPQDGQPTVPSNSQLQRNNIRQAHLSGWSAPVDAVTSSTGSTEYFQQNRGRTHGQSSFVPPQEKGLPGFVKRGESKKTSSLKPVANRPTLFRAIVNMMAIVEGGIIKTTDKEFPGAVNDALYGIRINHNSRLIYDQWYGLDLINMQSQNLNI